MKHTKECEDAQEAYKKSLAAYEKAADAAQAAWDKAWAQATWDKAWADAAWYKAHKKCKEVKA